jgi:AcrR family transcriptional regulator
MARHRPAAEGGYQRGEETRARIIEAAVELFGRHGFEGASTRDIARLAGVNAPALQYYFDNKEGVYLACAEYFASLVWESLAPSADAALAVLADPSASVDALIEAYLVMQRGYLSFAYDTPDDNPWRLFMARERAGLGLPGAYERIDQALNQRLFAVTSALMGRIMGRPPTNDEVKLRTIAIDGQSLTFRVLRRQVRSAMGWDSIGEPQADQLRSVVLEQTRVLLQALAAGRG